MTNHTTPLPSLSPSHCYQAAELLDQGKAWDAIHAVGKVLGIPCRRAETIPALVPILSVILDDPTTPQALQSHMLWDLAQGLSDQEEEEK